MRYIDLNEDTKRQIVVDKEENQYLGHVSSVLLEDGKTIVAVYPKGHGRGSIIEKKSFDGGLSWTERLPLPESCVTSMEVPTIFRTEDKAGKKRIVLFSGGMARTKSPSSARTAGFFRRDKLPSSKKQVPPAKNILL